MRKFKDPTKMNDNEVLEELKYLAKTIVLHDKFYYQDDNPEISDAEYDHLLKRNKLLEKHFPNLILENSPSLKVGIEPKSGFDKVFHEVPMLSLNNAFNLDEIEEFIERTRKFLKLEKHDIIEIFAEPKIDGLSATLIYQEGKLVVGSTRGDGRQGENITKNIIHINDIPKTLKNNFPKEIEVRGEIYISNNEFEKINKDRLKKGKPVFSNPRNAAAGTVRNLNPEITKSRNLGFFAYNWGKLSSSIGKTLIENRSSLESFGFKLSHPANICSNINEIKRFYDDLFEKRPNLDFDIDGVVYKLNDLSLYNRLGETDHSPRYSISHKFPPEQGVTILNDVSFQVGRTGAVTPVAELSPVTIGGVRVKRATLHNKDEILRLGIMIKDSVLLERAGDVIPKITGHIISLRPSSAREILFPTTCPSCGHVLENMKDETIIRCNNSLCKSQKLGQLIHFVSREAFNIEGLGEKQLKELFDLKIIENFGDIFRLTLEESSDIRKQITNLSGWGTLSISNIIKSINNSKSITLDRLIYSLGIRHVGQGASRIISNYFSRSVNFIDVVKSLSEKKRIDNFYDDLISIDGLGNKAATSLTKYFVDNIDDFNDLYSFITLKNIEHTNIDNPLFNKNIVFTGVLENLSRSEAKNLAETSGAIISNQISLNTDLLIVGSKPGSKLKKAKELSTRIVNEEEFLLFFRKI